MENLPYFYSTKYIRPSNMLLCVSCHETIERQIAKICAVSFNSSTRESGNGLVKRACFGSLGSIVIRLKYHRLVLRQQQTPINVAGFLFFSKLHVPLPVLLFSLTWLNTITSTSWYMINEVDTLALPAV